jgi:transposase-like protein
MLDPKNDQENAMECPNRGAKHIVKNGLKKNEKQNFLCRSCVRRFVENPSPHYRISEETRALIDRLPPEKIPPAGTARSAQVSERWLQYYVNDIYENIPRTLTALPKEKGRLTVECDAMWSFVKNKDNKHWIRLAIDRDHRCSCRRPGPGRSEGTAAEPAACLSAARCLFYRFPDDMKVSQDEK